MRIDSLIRTTVGLLAVLPAALLHPQGARAASLDGSTDLTTSSIQIPLAEGSQNVTYKASAPFGAATGGYLFGDRNGDGGNVAVTPGGLTMGGYYLRHNISSTSSATRSIRLNLDGGDLSASTGCISTRNAGETGEIAIFNVGTIAMGNGYLETMRVGAPDFNRSTGSILIGQDGPDGPRAGNVQVASIDASIREGSGTPGAIIIHSQGDVTIASSSDVPGSLITGKHPDNTSGEGNDILVSHQGNFKAGTVSNQRVNSANKSTWYQVTLDGGVLAAPTGACVLNMADTRGWVSSGATASRSIPSGHLLVRNYLSFHCAADILTATATYSLTRLNTATAGNVTITDITGDIIIAGAIDASSNASDNPVARRGVLTLTCGGAITLGSLDIDKINTASLVADGGAFIEGALLNFATTGSGTGSYADPVVTTQTALRAPAGAVIFYDAGHPDNGYLGDKVYRVAGLTGTSDWIGGLLMPLPASDWPLVVTKSPTDLGTTQATLHGVLHDGGGSDCTVTVYWDTNGDQGVGGSWAGSHSFGVWSGALPHEFLHELTDLAAGTHYTYRFAASNASGTFWGEPMSFNTVTTGAATVTLAADTVSDGATAALAFEETAATVVRDAWGEFSFSQLSSDPITFNLAGRKLYSGNNSKATIVLDLNGGQIIGNDNATNIVTYHADNQPADNLIIRNVGNIGMGAISTRANGSGTGITATPGSIMIGCADRRAGVVRIASIETKSGLDNHRVYGQPVIIYSSGAVTIGNATGSVPGDIITKAYISGGNVTVNHFGRLILRDIDTSTPGLHQTDHRPGSILLDGNDASDDLNIRNIVAYNTRTRYGSTTRPTITIARYANVAINGDILGYSGSMLAQNVTIKDGIPGNIVINGRIDLSQATLASRGTLDLAAGGSVTLAELDLEKVLSAQLTSGTGKSVITGALDNFDTAGTGDGTQASPVLTTQTALRAADGQKIYYTPAANPTLAGKVYRVADLAGGPAKGGLLMPQAPAGTVIILK